jgi:hypothetical protein
LKKKNASETAGQEKEGGRANTWDILWSAGHKFVFFFFFFMEIHGKEEGECLWNTLDLLNGRHQLAGE